MLMTHNPDSNKAQTSNSNKGIFKKHNNNKKFKGEKTLKIACPTHF